MRANDVGQVGFHDKEKRELVCSPYYVCSPGRGLHSLPFSPTILEFRGVFEAIMACLKKVCAECSWPQHVLLCHLSLSPSLSPPPLSPSQDTEWEAVFQLLHLLADILQCRTLTLAAMPDLSPLVPLLTALADDPSRPESRLLLFNTKLGKMEVASCVYPVLAQLAIYPGHLHRHAQVCPTPFHTHCLISWISYSRMRCTCTVHVHNYYVHTCTCTCILL